MPWPSLNGRLRTGIYFQGPFNFHDGGTVREHNTRVSEKVLPDGVVPNPYVLATRPENGKNMQWSCRINGRLVTFPSFATTNNYERGKNGGGLSCFRLQVFVVVSSSRNTTRAQSKVFRIAVCIIV